MHVCLHAHEEFCNYKIQFIGVARFMLDYVRIISKWNNMKLIKEFNLDKRHV